MYSVFLYGFNCVYLTFKRYFMTTKKISITRALVELKRLNDRISTAISAGTFVSTVVGKNSYQKVSGSNQSVVEMTGTIQSSFDSVDTLITNRARIKSAIVMSNALTKVTIMKQEMTVAEAIELKSTVVFRRQYLQVLRNQLVVANRAIATTNATLEAAIEVSLNNIYGSEKSKITDDTYKSVANPQKEQKEASLLDPQKIEAKIAALTEEISLLESEVDFTLSESNANTLIEV